MTELTEIKLVRPRDMLVGPYCNKSETCGCMEFWRNRQFDLQHSQLYEQHREVCRRVFGIEVTDPYYEERGVTRKDAADIYNHCLHEMGFTEGNPPLSEQSIVEIRQKLRT